MRILFEVLLTLAYFSLAEYTVHRFAMHRPLLGKFWWWREHAVEHHGKGRNDLNIALSPLTVTFIALPLVLGGGFWLGWKFAAAVVAAACAYAGLWTVLHTAHHDLGHRWLHSYRWYQWLRHTHELHHDDPRGNFGLIFPFTDDLFGTRVRDKIPH